MVDIVAEGIRKAMQDAPDFAGEVADNFMQVVSAVVYFVAQRLDSPRPYQRDDGKGASALEADLHEDLLEFLKSGALTGGLTITEPQKVGAGRADLLVTFDHHKVINELKRETSDGSRDALQAAYAAQGASYSATDYPLGLVTVLDLSVAPPATPHLRDCFWVHRYREPNATVDRWLVFARLPGRLRTPSELSR